MANHIDSYQRRETTWSAQSLKDSRAAAMAILLGMGMSSACATTPKTPKSDAPRDVIVQVPASVEAVTDEKAEEAPVEQEPKKIEPAEKYKGSKFVEDTRMDLNRKLCRDEYPKGIIPEIRGVIEGDNIEAITISGGFNLWELRFSPGLDSKQKEMLGYSVTSKLPQVSSSALDVRLMAIGNLQFESDLFKGDAPSWLLEKMKARAHLRMLLLCGLRRMVKRESDPTLTVRINSYHLLLD